MLCQKPISMEVTECRALIQACDRTGVKIGEAFMVRTHPHWLRARGNIAVIEAIFRSARTGQWDSPA